MLERRSEQLPIYGPNRGHDSIAVFRLALLCAMRLIIHNTGGKSPVLFALTLDERFLELFAN
jgi:6-phosphogluconolactonase (cycloisomerase 2 family)